MDAFLMWVGGVVCLSITLILLVILVLMPLDLGFRCLWGAGISVDGEMRQCHYTKGIGWHIK